MVEYVEKIDTILESHPEGLSVLQISEKLGLNRNSTARYLDVLHHQGAVKERKIGPAKLYVKSSHLPFSVQLHLFKQAMDKASCGISVADVRRDDMPLIYVNASFEKMTGYASEEILGKNCRFLQGKSRDALAVKKIRAAFKRGAEVTVVLKNYRKDGSLFYNELHLAPISSTQGELTHYVGIQTDVSYRYEKK